MMIELYHGQRSTCSQKVRLCLAEKGLSYVSYPVDLSRREHLRPEYLKINPNGVVPSLVHDGRAILDSSVICEYIDEVFPEPRLSPANAADRAHMRSWLRYLEEVPTPAIRVPTFNQIFRTLRRDMSTKEFDEWTGKMPLRKAFYRKMGSDGFSEQDVADAMERLQQTIARANDALSNFEWLAGNIYTVADIALIPTVTRLQDLGLSQLWQDKAPFADWFARVQQRPSFSIAYFEGSRMETDVQWQAFTNDSAA
jgi:glutathione S-transferase